MTNVGVGTEVQTKTPLGWVQTTELLHPSLPFLLEESPLLIPFCVRPLFSFANVTKGFEVYNSHIISQGRGV